MNFESAPTITKTIEVSPSDRQAEILRLNSPTAIEKKDLPPKPYLLLEIRQTPSSLEYIFIKQPFWGKIEMEYSDFDDLESEIDRQIDEMIEHRTHQNYKSIRNTGTGFFNEHEVIGIGLQDINKHVFEFDNELQEMLKQKYSLNSNDIKLLQSKHLEYQDTICVRELVKLEAHNLSDPKINQREDFYEICPGCTNNNHSEPNAIRNMIQSGHIDKLHGSSALVYRHWWSCKPCQEQLEKYGVKKIYLSRRWTKEYLKIN